MEAAKAAIVRAALSTSNAATSVAQARGGSSESGGSSLSSSGRSTATAVTARELRAHSLSASMDGPARPDPREMRERLEAARAHEALTRSEVVRAAQAEAELLLRRKAALQETLQQMRHSGSEVAQRARRLVAGGVAGTASTGVVRRL